VESDGLPHGVYDRLIDDGVRRALATAPDRESDDRALERAEVPDRLAAYLHDRLRDHLRGVGDIDEQVAITRRVLDALDGADPTEVRQNPGDGGLADPLRVLTRVRSSLLPGQDPVPLPPVPLSASDLLVNAKDEPRLGDC
jgi:hypothetical protein